MGFGSAEMAPGLQQPVDATSMSWSIILQELWGRKARRRCNSHVYTLEVISDKYTSQSLPLYCNNNNNNSNYYCYYYYDNKPCLR